MEILKPSRLAVKIFAQANIGLWAIEQEAGKPPRMFADATMLELLGIQDELSPEEVFTFWFSRIDPVHCGQVQSGLEAILRGEEVAVQYPWKHPDGSTVYIRCGGLRNPEYTDFIRIEGSHQNITRTVEIQQLLAQREESLARSRQFSDYFLESLLSAYYVDLRDGTFHVFRACGDHVQRYGSENFQSFMRNHAEDCVPEEERATLLYQVTPWNIRKRLKKANDFSYIFKEIVNGERRHIKLTIIRGADDDHVAVGFEDIEALTRERQDSQYQKKKLQEASIVASLSDDYEFIGMIDMAKDEMTTYRVLPKLAELVSDLGEDATEMKRMMTFCDRYVVPEEREHFYQMSSKERIRAELREHPVYIFDTKILIDGRPRYHRFKYAHEKNSKNKVIVGFRNIDDVIRNELRLVEMEKKLQYSKELELALAKAEEANRAKSTFLFNMSHDIRTPLNAIKGFTDMARKYIDDRERALGCLDKVLLSEDHLLRLVNDVLDLARIESGNTRIETAPVSVAEQGKYFTLMFSQETAARNIDYCHRQVNVRNDMVCSDKLHVNQVLINILNNAIKFTPSGGRITQTTEQLDDLPDGRHYFLFTVADTGIGMSPRFLEHIFEQFSRERSSTESGVQGTGLGMAITKHLVDLMDGKVEISSELGKGTTVRVYLPFDRYEEAPAEEIAANDGISLAGKRVLVVEDNELNREIAVDILQEEQLAVDEAENGVIAVEKVRKNGPGYYDFILMDIQMPVMDGYEATRKIRALQKPDERLPIIALSANAFEEDKKRSLEAGMDGHVAKPINVSELFGTLQTLLKSESAGAPATNETGE